MGNGLYGTNQGDECRAAGRHNTAIMAEERNLENDLVEGEVTKRWRMWYQAAMSGINATAWEALQNDVEQVTSQWVNLRLEGEDAGKWRSAVLKRIAALLAQASYNGR